LLYPSKFAQRVVIAGMKVIMFAQERILPDPKSSTPGKASQGAMQTTTPQPVGA